MSLNPISLGSNNSNITQNAEITQQSSSTKSGDVAVGIINSMPKLNLQIPRSPRSISRQTTQTDQNTSIESLAKASEIIHETDISSETAQNRSKPSSSEKPPASGSVLIKGEDSNLMKKLNNSIISESKIVKAEEIEITRNDIKTLKEKTTKENSGVINSTSKKVAFDNIRNILPDHEITAKEIFQISNKGKLLNSILNIKPKDIDSSQLVHVFNGNIICQEGQYIAENAQIKSHNGTISDLEYDKVFVMSQKDFNLFITPVLDSLHDTKKVESELEDPVNINQKRTHEFKQTNKSTLSEDPIMKKLLEAKEELQVLQKTQENRKASLREQQLNLQKEKDLKKKNAKTEERKEELKLYQ